MKGFLLHLSCRLIPTTISDRSISFVEGWSVGRMELSSGIELFTWGSHGDIHISHKRGHSLLIMFGFISEAPRLSPFTTQQDACDLIRAHFDGDHSKHVFCDFVSTLYGSFSFIYVSFKEQTVYTMTDRLSSRALWYKCTGDDLLVSSHSIPIARMSQNVRYSPGSLGAYLLYGGPVEPTKSLFSGIFCQREGTLLKHKHGSDSAETTWYKYHHTPDKNRSIKSWVQLSSERFVKAAERMLKTTSKPLLFLSGGVDSRLAGAALIAAGGSPLLCTLGDSMNLEVRVAKAVAKTFQCQHEIIIRDDEWYLRAIPRAMFNSNGMYSWSHSHFSEAYSNLQVSHNVDSAFIGDFCEAFSKLLCNVPKERTELWTENEFISEFDKLPLPNYRPINRKKTLNLLQEDFREVTERQLRHDILSRYARVSRVSDDPLIVGDHFFRWQTTSCAATFQMFNDVRSAGPERNLMFDKDLHHLLEIMPSAVRSQNNLGSKLVNRLCPQAAMIPNANSMLPLLFPNYAHSLSKRMKPKLGKIRRFLFSNTHHTTASWSHLPLLYSGHPTWKKEIENRLLDDSTLPSEMFKRSAVEQCWREFCAGDITLHADIERLFGLAILGSFFK